MSEENTEPQKNHMPPQPQGEKSKEEFYSGRIFARNFIN
jgi:hypothetical protein